MKERKPRVLLVEDNSGDEMLALRALREYGADLSVFVARDGEQALQVVRRLHGQLEDYPALIILDLSLPKVSGLEVLGAVKHNPELAAIPVVIVTGSDDPEMRAACLRLGADAFLIKPFDYRLYFEMLRPILADTLGPLAVASATSGSVQDAVTLL